MKTIRRNSEYPAIFDENGNMVDRPYCKAHELTCSTGYSTLVYRAPTQECRLALLKSIQFYELGGYNFLEVPKTPKTTFNAPKSEKSIPKKETPTVLVAVNPEDAIRFVLKGIITKCSTPVNSTDYEGIYVSTEIVHSAKANIDKTDIKLQHYFNNKMNFLYHHGMMKLEKVYQETIINDCRLNREIVKTKLAIAMTNPDVITPLLLEPGTFARVMGEVLYTYKCQKVDIKDIKIRDNKGKCTNELPIIYSGRAAYLSPITRIINYDVRSVKIINCSNYMSPMYEVQQGTWITLPDKHIVLPPSKMELIELIYDEKFKPLDTVSSNGVYSSKDIEAARRFILFPQKRERILTEMVYTLNGGQPGGTNFELLLSPEHFARATHNTMKRIWGKFLVFGQLFAGLMGIYCIFVCLKIILSQLLSTYHIYKIGGLTWKLILGCFPFLAKYVLFHHQYNIIKSMQKEHEEHEDVELHIDPTNLTNHQFLEKTQIRHIQKDNTPPRYEISTKCNQIAPQPVYRQIGVAKSIGPVKSYRATIMNMDIQSEETQLHSLQLYPVDQIEEIRRDDIIKEYRRRNGILVIIGPGDTSPSVRMEINGKNIIAIYDTGSPITLMHKSLLTQEQLESCDKETNKYTSISGQELDIIGKLWVEMIIEHEQIFTSIRILNEGACNCILGMNMINEIEQRGLIWLTQRRKPVKIDIIYSENYTNTIRLKRKWTIDQGNKPNENDNKKLRILAISDNIQPKPYINIKINGRRINALIDTGAATTLLHRRFLFRRATKNHTILQSSTEINYSPSTKLTGSN